MLCEEVHVYDKVNHLTLQVRLRMFGRAWSRLILDGSEVERSNHVFISSWWLRWSKCPFLVWDAEFYSTWQGSLQWKARFSLQLHMQYQRRRFCCTHCNLITLLPMAVAEADRFSVRWRRFTRWTNSWRVIEICWECWLGQSLVIRWLPFSLTECDPCQSSRHHEATFLTVARSGKAGKTKVLAI